MYRYMEQWTDIRRRQLVEGQQGADSSRDRHTLNASPALLDKGTGSMYILETNRESYHLRDAKLRSVLNSDPESNPKIVGKED